MNKNIIIRLTAWSGEPVEIKVRNGRARRIRWPESRWSRRWRKVPS